MAGTEDEGLRRSWSSFAVDVTPRRMWGVELLEQNRTFLAGLDPAFFTYASGAAPRGISAATASIAPSTARGWSSRRSSSRRASAPRRAASAAATARRRCTRTRNTACARTRAASRPAGTPCPTAPAGCPAPCASAGLRGPMSRARRRAPRAAAVATWLRGGPATGRRPPALQRPHPAHSPPLPLPVCVPDTPPRQVRGHEPSRVRERRPVHELARRPAADLRRRPAGRDNHVREILSAKSVAPFRQRPAPARRSAMCG